MEISFVSPTVRQEGYRQMVNEESLNVFTLKNEKFGLQVSLTLDEDTWVNLNDDQSLPFKGLVKRCRLALDGDFLNGKLYFEDLVNDDDNISKRDLISTKTAQLLKKGTHFLWADLQFATPGKQNLTLKQFENINYDPEKLVQTANQEIEVSNVPTADNQSFYLDLWQHLSSLARYYQVPLWSDEHFELIENYLEPLKEADQKVCDLVLTDFPWAGQGCFAEDTNPSSLYEYNIVEVYQTDGKISCDFSHLDRYLALAEKYQMDDEIDLFGLVGNWSAKDFGNPINDYRDPLRIRYYDVDQKRFAFIESKAQVKEYLELVFKHLQELGIWDKVLVMADEPSDLKVMEGYQAVLQSCSELPINYKLAILHDRVVKEQDHVLKNYSLISSIICDNIHQPDSIVTKSLPNLTWYTCCFPKNLNQFIHSPLMESRLVGPLTYLFNMKGFLRWNYCLWTTDPFSDVTYKDWKWAAGDMFFVYPGKNGKPEYSLRFKQLIYGIQDFNFFKYCETKLGRAAVIETVQKLTGKIDDVSYNKQDDTINLKYHDDYNILSQIKKELVNKIKNDSL
ncbi:DUF4091 domain-containing protein [Companilactobacillus sp.]|uniref:DUF4091 domain-containing protein n=1 Tax=Companilactobacillus sp. TaxID=2767905 RepID=UPI0025B8FAE8|nr:DUF4091 domain-containing protein [Companilactobacillus sp.]MCH4008829.1 DUF4091 domain-containing protein [Companilactobacillus sp.]MCH4050992.1 DUF4091 domain-containing protein [Companilactobacillus sp.]MCH4076772.1 DUF4091 domain-containing protein [Companilactobacillus sp.]MCH4125347.1 DUF4091 domain-containing protein [Companilactobacillus sp.]MCH4131888.1 DUF4091 domain-containing protein [Companilactobacillus sp.]